MALIDVRNAVLYIKDAGSNQLEVKIGQGNLTYNVARQIDYVLSRGKIDTSRENEDVPMTVSFQFMWEYLKSQSPEIASIEEALNKSGPASSWVSANPDTKAPFSVNLVLLHTPICPGVYKEQVLLPQFNFENLAYSVVDSSVACNGKCNARKATITRLAP